RLPTGGDEQAAEDRTGAHRRGHETEAGGADVQPAVSHDGERDLKLVGEAAGDRHHHQRDGERGGVADVAQTFAQLPLGAGGGGNGGELGEVHRPQREDDRDEAHGVDEEADAVADGGDEDSGNGRADRAGDVVV